MTQIRPAIKGDENAIMELIQALAEYEKAPEQVVNTAEALGQHLFEEEICKALLLRMIRRLLALHCTSPIILLGKENVYT